MREIAEKRVQMRIAEYKLGWMPTNVYTCNIQLKAVFVGVDFWCTAQPCGVADWKHCTSSCLHSSLAPPSSWQRSAPAVKATCSWSQARLPGQRLLQAGGCWSGGRICPPSRSGWSERGTPEGHWFEVANHGFGKRTFNWTIITIARVTCPAPIPRVL